MKEKPINVKIPEQLHYDLKRLSVSRRVTMKELLVSLIKREVDESKEKKEISMPPPNAVTFRGVVCINP